MTQFYIPTKIITGLGCFSQLAEVAQSYGRKALLTCGRSAMKDSGVLERAMSGLQAAGIQTVLYDAVSGEPTLEMVQAAVNLVRREGVEMVIGIGGGSAMDVAKAAAILCKQPGTVQEYHRGKAISKPGLPCIAVPTTAGTGAEVTNNAVLTDAEREVKESIRSPYLFAAAALVDPELTLSMPPAVTASSGADALCQAIESFVALAAQPLTDALTRQAIGWIGRSLVRAYEQGSDVHARADMLYGSLLAGMALTNTRLGGAHALAHPLGYRYHIPHGVLCGLLLPYVMQYSLDYALDKYAEVASLLGADTQNLGPHAAAQQAVEAIRGILQRVGIPMHLAAFGVKKADLPDIIAGALRSSNAKNNPRPLAAEDLRAILEQAL